jgi:hypothetical protein
MSESGILYTDSILLHMPSSPATKPSTKRKRKAQVVVDSDDESDYELPAAAESPPAISKGNSKQSKTSTKGKATTRKRKGVASQIFEDDTDKDKGATIAENAEPIPSQTETPPAVVTTQDVEMKDKEGDKQEEKTNEEKRPAKRSKLPSMRRNPNTIASTSGNIATPPPEKISSSQPTASSTPTLPAAGPPRRKIVDAPPSGDVDLRNEDVFSQLFKKVCYSHHIY